ncbi:MAG: OmpP1/FadL family transporter [Bacteroidales bacterium]
MRNKIIAILFFTGIAISAHSQDLYDVIRFGRINPGGTARSVGMGGAFGALGGDLSTLAVNPAGIGVFRASEFSVTPSLYLAHSKSDYLNNSYEDSRTNFNLGNFGVVFSNEITDRLGKGGFKFVQFGVSLNRIADFNNKYYMQGRNYGSSRADIWFQQIQGKSLADLQSMYPIDLYPAYQAYLFNPSGNNNYDTFLPDIPGFQKSGNKEASLLQTYTMETKGSLNEFDFSVGANYDDVLYMGFTLGVPYIRYIENSSIREENDLGLAPSPGSDPQQSFFNSYQFDFTREIYATGINLKGGIIVRPVKFLRFGFAAHTPTWYPTVNFSQYSTITTDLFHEEEEGKAAGFYRTVQDSKINEFEFRMRTPYRLIASTAITFGKAGLLSADYEFVDYPTSKYSASDYNYTNDNRAIQNMYKSGHNFRVGTEWRVNNFSFRGGFNYFTSPFENKDYKNAEVFGYSAGLGFRERNFYFDLAWALQTTNDDFYPYSNQGVGITSELAKNKLSSNRILMTFGYRF